jgi:hypothetical protein
VMTGDDHAEGGTAGRFDQYKAASTPGCSVANWECVRSTSYIYPSSPLTNAQAAAYTSEGFEVAIHVTPTGSLSCADWTPTSLVSRFDTQLGEFAAKYTSIPASVTHRLHCVTWSDWSTLPKVERDRGMKLDTNYYHYPDTWIADKPGFMTGSGMPMRFADTDGTLIDVYQAHTHMTDEGGQSYPSTVNALLDKALGPQGYYGAFVANAHTDFNPSPMSDAIVASAQARGVPIISAKQLLEWVEARNASSFASLRRTGNVVQFDVVAAAGANGLQALLPVQSGALSLQSLTRGGTGVAYTTSTIKGVSYAVFPAVGGSYAATYG